MGNQLCSAGEEVRPGITPQVIRDGRSNPKLDDPWGAGELSDEDKRAYQVSAARMCFKGDRQALLCFPCRIVEVP